MRRFILMQVFLLISGYGIAQTDVSELATHNETRLQMTRTGMTILGSWALGNMLVSPILASRSTGAEKHFHQMNAYWNIVNFGIAAVGYFNTLNQDVRSFTMATSLSEQHLIEKVLLFNTGLDIAYVLGGFYMIERSRRSSNQGDRLKGFGRSVVLQGAFLFAFDLLFYLKINQHGAGLTNILKQLSVTPNSVGFTYMF